MYKWRKIICMCTARGSRGWRSDQGQKKWKAHKEKHFLSVRHIRFRANFFVGVGCLRGWDRPERRILYQMGFCESLNLLSIKHFFKHHAQVGNLSFLFLFSEVKGTNFWRLFQGCRLFIFRLVGMLPSGREKSMAHSCTEIFWSEKKISFALIDLN